MSRRTIAGQVIAQGFDAASHLTKRTVSLGWRSDLSRRIRIGYDNLGRKLWDLEGYVDASGVETETHRLDYAYDAVGRLERREHDGGNP